MAIMRVGYKRTFQTRPYETQVIELVIEEEAAAGANPKLVMKELELKYSALEAVGDGVMAKSLAKSAPAGRK